jgi:hypothetical protein
LIASIRLSQPSDYALLMGEQNLAVNHFRFPLQVALKLVQPSFISFTRWNDSTTCFAFGRCFMTAAWCALNMSLDTL